MTFNLVNDPPIVDLVLQRFCSPHSSSTQMHKLKASLPQLTKHWGLPTTHFIFNSTIGQLTAQCDGTGHSHVTVLPVHVVGTASGVVAEPNTDVLDLGGSPVTDLHGNHESHDLYLRQRG